MTRSPQQLASHPPSGRFVFHVRVNDESPLPPLAWGRPGESIAQGALPPGARGRRRRRAHRDPRSRCGAGAGHLFLVDADFPYKPRTPKPRLPGALPSGAPGPTKPVWSQRKKHRSSPSSKRRARSPQSSASCGGRGNDGPGIPHGECPGIPHESGPAIPSPYEGNQAGETWLAEK